jgi:hypothetical protein
MEQKDISLFPPQAVIESFFVGLKAVQNLDQDLQNMAIQDLLKKIQTNPQVEPYIKTVLPNIGSLEIGEIKWDLKPSEDSNQQDYSIQQLYDTMHPPQKI